VFAVTFTLTDRGTATASAGFTITTAEEACMALGGERFFIAEQAGLLWRCVRSEAYRDQLEPFYSVWLTAFQPYCPGTVEVEITPVGPLTWVVNARCRTS
jgi:hypothetical protein